MHYCIYARVKWGLILAPFYTQFVVEYNLELLCNSNDTGNILLDKVRYIDNFTKRSSKKHFGGKSICAA